MCGDENTLAATSGFTLSCAEISARFWIAGESIWVALKRVHASSGIVIAITAENTHLISVSI